MARLRLWLTGLLLIVLASACNGNDPAPGTAVAGASPSVTATAVLPATPATPAPSPSSSPQVTVSPTPAFTPAATATSVRTATAAAPSRTATPPPPTASSTPASGSPFPQATVLPGSIDLMMGGRFESPRPGDRITSPVAIRGYANAFEGAVLLVLRDRAGAAVGQAPATGAMGSFGSFAVNLTASIDPARSPYTLELTVQSPRDGATSVIAQVPVVAGTAAGTGRELLSGGALPATIRLSQPRVRNAGPTGFEVEFVSSSPCQGAVFFPAELAGRTIGTTQSSDEQRVATYHIVRVDARLLSNLERGRRYRWYITCENPATTPPSPDTRVSLPFEQAIPEG